VPRVNLELRRLQTEGFVLLTRIQRKLDDLLVKLFTDRNLSDITPKQATVLMVLVSEGRPLLARRIAELLALSEVTVGRFVHALNKGQWIERTRDEQDGRNILISPTTKSTRTLPLFINLSNQIMDRAFAGFSADEISDLVGFVKRIAENLQAEPPTN